MRSGETDIDRNHEYYRTTYDEIKDKEFTPFIFTSIPALRLKDPVDKHRMVKPYKGGDYDKKKYDLIEGMWDHEHCCICFFKILPGYTYWSNADEIDLLCDECHDFFAE